MEVAKAELERLDQEEYTAKHAFTTALDTGSEVDANLAIEHLLTAQNAAIAAKSALNTAYIRVATTKRAWKLLKQQHTKEYTDFLRQADDEWFVFSHSCTFRTNTSF